MADRISYVGLDVHKDGIVVAIADSGLRGEVRINHSERVLLSRQQQPDHHRGDDRERITRARQAAEALFRSKPPVSTPAAQQTASANPSARRPRVLPISPASVRHDEPESPVVPAPLPVEIPPSQVARIRTWLKYGMKVAQVAQICGVPVGEIERILGKA